MKRLIRSFWRCFKWGGLIAAVALAICAFYIVGRVDEEIRREVESRLRAHYPNLIVKVAAAKRLDGEGIEVRGLSFYEPGASGPQAELATFDEIVLVCNSDLQELAQGNLDVRQVNMRRATLRFVRRADGSWSASRLLPLPCLSERPLEGTIEAGTIEVFDPTKNPSSTLVLRDVQLTWGPAFDMPPSSNGRPMLRLRGQATSDHLRRSGFEMVFDPAGGYCQASGRFDDVEVCQDLARSLPGETAAAMTSMGATRAMAAGEYRVTHDPSRQPALDFQIAGRLTRGQIDDRRLPYPVTDVAANFQCSADGIAIDELTGRSGPASIRMSLRRSGYTAASLTTVSAECTDLLLDGKLLDILPDTLRFQWHKFLPSGALDVRLDLNHDGRRWQANHIVAGLRDVSFTFYKFPYRLERTSGSIRLVDDKLTIDLTAFSRAEPVRIVGDVLNVGPEWGGLIEVRADRIEVDEKLLMALPAKCGDIVRSLHPQGTFNVWSVFERTAGLGQPLRKRIVLNFQRGSIRYDRFPYPLYDVRGSVDISDDAWVFRELEGINDTGHVTCNGEMTVDQAGSALTLNLGATNLPVDEELRHALNPTAQRLWNDLRPRGATNVEAKVRYTTASGVDVWVRAEPVGDSASIEPTQFPYRFDKLRGAFVFDKGRVTFEGASAEHGRTLMRASGLCETHPNGAWRMRLEDMSVDRLWADRDVVQALGGRLRRAITNLRLTGPINLRGMIDLVSPNTPEAGLVAKWNLAVDLQQNGVSAGVPIQNIHGGVWLLGGFDGHRFQSHGEVAVDSATIHDYQFTDVRGPIWLDDDRVLVGVAAHREVARPHWFDEQQALRAYWTAPDRPPSHERQLTAALYGGSVAVDGTAILESAPQYSITATLTGGDLRKFARETLVRTQEMSGEVFATVQLQGQGSGVNLLTGGGAVRLRNAAILKLPVMVALLKILSVRLPDTSAFSKADIDFRVEGGHIYLDRIDCNGDAISLLGNGEMNFNRDIRLAFHAMVGTDELKIPGLRELVGGASQQIMMIHVGGTLDEPQMYQQAFPGFAQALEHLQLQPARDPAMTLPLPSGYEARAPAETAPR